MYKFAVIIVVLFLCISDLKKFYRKVSVTQSDGNYSTYIELYQGLISSLIQMFGRVEISFCLASIHVYSFRQEKSNYHLFKGLTVLRPYRQALHTFEISRVTL